MSGSPRPITDVAPVPWLRQHPQVADGLFAVTLFVLAASTPFAIDLASHYPRARPPSLLSVALVAAMCLPLTWRRRVPLTVMAVTIGGLVPYLILNYPDTFASFGPLLATYTVGAHCERRASLTAFVVASLVMLPVLVAGVFYDEVQLPWPAVVGNYGIYFAAWALGDSLRSRRAYLAELEHRAERAERDRAAEAARAVQAERARIARELHDVVAHGMAVMIVQAGAARRVVDTRPEQAAEAIGQIESTGREAMVEMRRLIGVLRDEEGPGGGAPSSVDDALPAGRFADEPNLAPQPGVDDVAGLVERWREAGLDVSYQLEGEARPLPAGIDLSTYRIVQEALTNVSKHAGPARAEVTVRFDADAVTVTVVDDGRGDATAAGGPAGHGIVGMRERAALVGGELSAGPRPGGGFAVTARLPLVGAGTAA